MIELPISERLAMLARELEVARELMVEAANTFEPETIRGLLDEAGNQVEKVEGELQTMAKETKATR